MFALFIQHITQLGQGGALQGGGRLVGWALNHDLDPRCGVDSRDLDRGTDPNKREQNIVGR